jgi:hypothetical protein
MRFADEIQASFPAGLILPPAFRLALDWMEDAGCVRNYARGDGRFATLYPASLGEAGTSIVSFAPVDVEDVAAWLGRDMPATERLAPFIQTGGDGSQAAIWLAPDGRQRFVHLGSGSGSTWAGLIADDPIDVLRLLAAGYREACSPEYFDETPEDVFWENDDFDEEFVPPTAFQTWLTTTFGVTIPRTGREIVRVAADMNARSPTDPFLLWLREAQALREDR